MEFIKKHKIIFTLLVLSLVYFATRLYDIMSLPLFTDEAIYVRWSQIARWDANWRFISLTDGKQPSFVWVTMNIMRAVNDPLLAGRLTSVFAGFVALIGMYFLSSEVFRSRRVGLIASLLYLLYPFALVYDRMALYDSLVVAATIWVLYFHIKLVRAPRLDTAMLLGFALGAAVLTKTSGFLSIYFAPLLLLLFNFYQKPVLKRLFKYGGFLLISVLLCYGFYSILRLSPFYHIIDDKNAVFVYPFNEWISHPFRFVIGNLHGMNDWLITYMTYPVLGLALASFIVRGKSHVREKILLFLWFLTPYIALAVFAKLLYPRFIFFMTIPLLILASYSLYTFYERYKNILSRAILFLIFFGMFIRADFYILTNFARAPIPKADLVQYINGWPAGGGVNEIIKRLSEESKNQKIFVLSTGTFGSLPTYAVEIYLGDNKNVDKQGIYPIPNDIPVEILEKAKTMPVFVFMSNQEEFYPYVKTWPMQELVSYQKGIGDSYSKLYRVIPQ